MDSDEERRPVTYEGVSVENTNSREADTFQVQRSGWSRRCIHSGFFMACGSA